MHANSWVVARKRFGYAGRNRTIGEVFQFQGLRNDAKLWGLTAEGTRRPGPYTDPFKGDPKALPTCGVCGSHFENTGRLEMHGNQMHTGGG